MVELRAELQGVGTYLAGEWVTCAVTFTNCGEGEETVAWAGGPTSLTPNIPIVVADTGYGIASGV